MADFDEIEFEIKKSVEKQLFESSEENLNFEYENWFSVLKENEEKDTN